MKNTKERICETAKQLFAQYPYSEVSMRSIADETGIAIGNLTYHFPKKGDLILYMQKDLFDNMRAAIAKTQQEEHTLQTLVDMVRAMQKNREENSFLYRNMMEIIRDAPQIAENGDRFVEGIYQYFVNCFARLRTSGDMRVDLDLSCYEALAYNIVYMTQVWMMSGTLYDNKTVPKKELSEVILMGLQPYLTERGMEEYHNIIKQSQ